MPKVAAAAKDKNKRKASKPKDKEKSKNKNKNAGEPVDGKFFPMEKGPTPSKMEPKDITRLYKLPDGKLKTEEDVIKKNNYKMEEKLDAGGFGVIFFARDVKKDLRVACKMCELGSDWKDNRVVDMKNELFIMEKVKHLYVVKLYTHFITQSSDNGNRLYIFMELADGGNFAKFCQKKGAMTEKEAALYFAQIVCGVNHMHSLGIAHRDIKLQNVLLLKNEKSISGDFTLLVADFGLSRILHHDPKGKIAMNKTCCGTPIFMAPEILLKKPYNAFSVDVWALGITLFIMLALELPFDFRDQQAAIKKMVAKDWKLPPEKIKAPPSKKLSAVLSGMIEPEWTKRLTMPKLLTNSWLADSYKKAQAKVNEK